MKCHWVNDYNHDVVFLYNLTNNEEAVQTKTVYRQSDKRVLLWKQCRIIHKISVDFWMDAVLDYIQRQLNYRESIWFHRFVRVCGRNWNKLGGKHSLTNWEIVCAGASWVFSMRLSASFAKCSDSRMQKSGAKLRQASEPDRQTLLFINEHIEKNINQK